MTKSGMTVLKRKLNMIRNICHKKGRTIYCLDSFDSYPTDGREHQRHNIGITYQVLLYIIMITYASNFNNCKLNLEQVYIF